VENNMKKHRKYTFLCNRNKNITTTPMTADKCPFN